MTDKHLNLFHTYNRDAELIENNLTRAFIVTMSLLTDGMRQFVLNGLIASREPVGSVAETTEPFDFASASFALQSHMDRRLPRSAQRKLLLTLSTEPLAKPTNLLASIVDDGVHDQAIPLFWSVPDGWVFRDDRSFCILIEAKVGSYPLDPGQLRAHARDWFGVGRGTPLRDVGICSITWTDVLAVLESACAETSLPTKQDHAIGRHLAEFIRQYGYRLFRGFDLGALEPAPNLRVLQLLRHGDIAERLEFSRLSPPPDLRLATEAGR